MVLCMVILVLLYVVCGLSAKEWVRNTMYFGGREVERLQRALQKKSAHVEQLVASQRALLKSKSMREDELNEQTTQLRQEIDQVAVQRKLLEQGRKRAEQQAENMKQTLKSKSEDLAAAHKQLTAVEQERDAANERIRSMEVSQRQHEELMSDLQDKYNNALQQVAATRMEHKSEVNSLQDREESLSSATVQFTSELARSERRRMESESAARKAEEQQRAAEEEVCRLQLRLEEQESACEEQQGVILRLQDALDARGAAEESERQKLEAEVRESSKRLAEVEMQLRQTEKQLAESQRAASRAAMHSRTAELEEQLNKMCEDVLAKQALLEQVMSERMALRSRLESEIIRNTDLQVGRQGARAADRNASWCRIGACVSVWDERALNLCLIFCCLVARPMRLCAATRLCECRCSRVLCANSACLRACDTCLRAYSTCLLHELAHAYCRNACVRVCVCACVHMLRTTWRAWKQPKPSWSATCATLKWGAADFQVGVQGLGFSVLGFGFRFHGPRRAASFQIGVSGFGFRVSGSGFRDRYLRQSYCTRVCWVFCRISVCRILLRFLQGLPGLCRILQMLPDLPEPLVSVGYCMGYCVGAPRGL